MSTSIRPEVSKRNPYWIEKNRYYELKYFCLQYPVWSKAYYALDGLEGRPTDLEVIKKYCHGDPTAKCAIARESLRKKMNLVTETALRADKDLAPYILMSVTKSVPYTALKTKYEIPCSRDVFYDLRRKFFWLLNSVRD